MAPHAAASGLGAWMREPRARSAVTRCCAGTQASARRTSARSCATSCFGTADTARLQSRTAGRARGPTLFPARSARRHRCRRAWTRRLSVHVAACGLAAAAAPGAAHSRRARRQACASARSVAAGVRHALPDARCRTFPLRIHCHAGALSRLTARSSPPHMRPTIPRPQEGARSIPPASTPGEASTLTCVCAVSVPACACSPTSSPRRPAHVRCLCRTARRWPGIRLNREEECMAPRQACTEEATKTTTRSASPCLRRTEACTPAWRRACRVRCIQDTSGILGLRSTWTRP